MHGKHPYYQLQGFIDHAEERGIKGGDLIKIKTVRNPDVDLDITMTFDEFKEAFAYGRLW